MILKRFLSSRRKRLATPETQDALIETVHSAQDTAVRRDVCRRISRLPELRELAGSDIDAGVREIAMARYRNLLCQAEQETPLLTERLAEIGALDDQQLVQHLASDGEEAEIRRAAIARIASQTVLAACAINDGLAANRAAAAARLQDKQALEQLVKGIGKKDKNVLRLARQKLREVAERDALPERIRSECEDLCERLANLGRFDSWVQDRAILDTLDRKWAEIGDEAPTKFKTRYEELRNRFLGAYEEYRHAHEAQIAAEEAREAIRNERRAILDQLSAATAIADENEAAASIEQLTERWNGLPPLAETEQSALQRRYSNLVAEASAHLKKLTAHRDRGERLQRLLQRAEETLEQPRPLEHNGIRKLLREARPLLDADGTDKSLAERFAETRDKLDERLRKQERHAEQRLEQLPEKLDELAETIESGELRHAEPVYQSLLAAIDLIQASGLPRAAYAGAAKRLHELAPLVRDLQKWRKWGTDQHRQSLCQAMDELAGADMPLSAIALRLQDLQAEWKHLDKGGSPVNQPMWERFHEASDRVYERCRPYLTEQAAERAANRQEREQLCRELEEFLDKVDWEHLDWKKAVRAERETRQAWATMGEVEARHRRPIEKRFRTALKRLDTRLAEERDRNQQHKRDLITAVEALVDEPDLDQAIQETKRLQRDWITTVAARQKDENRLWQQFRAACDAVFARRRERHEAENAELSENLGQREAICEQAEKIAEEGTEPQELMRTFRELEREWRDTERLPIPRSAAGALHRRWSEAEKRVHNRRRQLMDEGRRRALDLLARQAAVCEQLERELETADGPTAALEAAKATWQELPAQGDAELQAAIEQRFRSAANLARQDDSAREALGERFAANGAQRAELCLHLEILAGVESPPELADERLAFQVSRLKGHMRQGEKDPLEGAARLLQEWYLCGPAPQSSASALEERFERARTALQKTERDNEAA